MDTRAVAAFIVSLGLSQSYATQFQQHAVNGATLVTLNENDLEAIGVDSHHDRQRILIAVIAMVE